MISLALGCSSSGSKADSQKKPPSEEEKESQVVNSESGTATGYTLEGPRQKTWTVAWKSGRIIITGDGNQITDMNSTSGSFMQKGEEASTFKADKGSANKAAGDIDVTGNVTVVSLAHDATLRCEKVHYTSKGDQIVRATGNVSIEGKWGTVSGLSEVWATPDLKVFGTPDLFQKR